MGHMVCLAYRSLVIVVALTAMSHSYISVQNVAICWKIPRIPYAARYGVGTISRKGSVRRLLRDYTPRSVSHEI